MGNVLLALPPLPLLSPEQKPLVIDPAGMTINQAVWSMELASANRISSFALHATFTRL
jgi:hypothetical protein